jgi:multidrug efflux pump
MKVSALFIERPVATTLLAVAIFLSGVLAYFRLPVAPLPNITFPVVVVQATMAGASPEIMASAVVEPLERRLGTIAGVNELTSTSYVGSARIVAQFDVGRDINGAARDVQAAIQASRADLPTTLGSNPTWRQFNPADAPIMVLALTSDTLTKAQLYDSANTVIQQQLSQISGVGQITLGGSALPAVRIELEPDKLNSYGLGMEDVRAAVSAANADSAKGDIDQGAQRFEVTSNDQATSAADYRNLVIAYRNNAPVFLHDVAEVIDSNENIRNIGLYNGTSAVGVIVYPIPGANIVATTAQIRKVLPAIEATLPHGAHVNVAMDRSQSVNAAVGDTERTLLIAVVLVIGVVFVFLQSPRSLLIPAVALPLSIIGTFGPMYLVGYSIDNLSLMALTIGTGFVVDDAVVVLENIVRHLEAGLDRKEAALRGSAEVSFTVVSMSLSLVAVFIPILLMPGTVGLLFHEFAVTLTIAILISMVISLTITPCMCAYVLRGRQDLHSRARWAVWAEGLFDRFRNIYARSLRAVLSHRLLTGAVMIALIAGNVFLFKLLPSTFFPEQDTGIILGQIIADQAISFPAMSEKLAQLQGIVQKDPAVASVFGFAGSGSAGRAGNTETDRRETRFGATGHPAPAAEAQRHCRCPALAAGAAGPAHRRQAVGIGVPIHTQRRRSEYPLHPRAQADRRARQALDRLDRRQYGHAAERPADLCSNQPGDGRALRARAQPDRCSDLRRLRTAHGLDHLQSLQSVFRSHGGRAEVLGPSAEPQPDLPQHRRRQRDGHATDADAQPPGERREGIPAGHTPPGGDAGQCA